MPDTTGGLGHRKCLWAQMRHSARHTQSPAGVLQGVLSRGFPCPLRVRQGKRGEVCTGLCYSVPLCSVSTQGQSMELKKGGKEGKIRRVRKEKEMQHLFNEEAPTPGTANLQSRKRAKGLTPVTQRKNNERYLPKQGSGLRHVAVSTNSLVTSPLHTRGR